MGNRVKYLKVLVLLCGGLFTSLTYAADPEWDDVRVDNEQLKNPVDYLSNDDLNDYENYYSRYSNNLKVRIADYGLTNESTGREDYKLQKYGVEILNKNKVYRFFKMSGTYNQELWLRVDNIWLDEEMGYIALTVLTNEDAYYRSLPIKKNDFTTYVYNLKTNKFIRLNLISESSPVDADGITTRRPMHCSAGARLSYSEKTKLFTYIDHIQKDCDVPTNEQTIKKMLIYKVTFDRNLECVSTNKLAGGCSDGNNVNGKIGTYPAEFIRMKKK